jgi:hypothetical protein
MYSFAPMKTVNYKRILPGILSLVFLFTALTPAFSSFRKSFSPQSVTIDRETEHPRPAPVVALAEFEIEELADNEDGPEKQVHTDFLFTADLSFFLSQPGIQVSENISLPARQGRHFPVPCLPLYLSNRVLII